MDAMQQGIRKAAILVASLDTKAADALLDQMAPRWAEQVRRQIMAMGEIDPVEQRRVIDEFYRCGPKPVRYDAGVELDGALARQVGPSPRATMPRPAARAAAKAPRPFASLGDAEADKLAQVLAAERPQTIALVLAHLAAEQSGAVLVRLSPAVQADVLRRLIDLEETDPEILGEVEAAIEARLARHVQMQRRRVAGLSAVAGILESCPSTTGMEILANLGTYDRPLAEQFNPPAIDFDDIAEFDDASLGAVFRAAGDELTRLALIGAAPRLVERVLRRLPIEQAAALRDALESPGVIRLSDIEEAKDEIAEVARRLAAQNTIRPLRRQPVDAAA